LKGKRSFNAKDGPLTMKVPGAVDGVDGPEALVEDVGGAKEAREGEVIIDRVMGSSTGEVRQIPENDLKHLGHNYNLVSEVYPTTAGLKRIYRTEYGPCIRLTNSRLYPYIWVARIDTSTNPSPAFVRFRPFS
jgi:hypothetical protein